MSEKSQAAGERPTNAVVILLERNEEKGFDWLTFGIRALGLVLVMIAGTALALEHLDVDAIRFGLLEPGHGTIQAAHGVLPVPAPATLELLYGVPVRLGGEAGEWVTPTGAAILTALGEPALDGPALRIERGARPRVHTAGGIVTARYLVVAGNAYLGGLVPELAAKSMPCGTQIIVTEPLGAERAGGLIPSGYCVEDHNYILDYFRCTADHRLLYGGGVSYGGGTPTSILAFIRKKMLKQSRENGIFLAFMTGNALKHRPPLGFFRDFVLVHDGEHNNTLDLKHTGIVPIIDLARIYSLAEGIPHIRTIDRLVHAGDTPALSSEGSANLLDAFEFIGTLRIRHQAEQIRRGEKADNFLPPEKLSKLEREHLKDAFRVISTMQETLGSRYQAGRLA